MFFLPYSMFQLLMDVETLLLTPTTPHLRSWTAKLYPLTLFFSFSPNLDLHYGTLLESLHLIYLYPQPACTHHHRTLTLPHTLCKHLYAIYIIATTDLFLCSYSPYPCNSNQIG